MREFWNNLLRYPRFLIMVSLGVFWSFLEPLVPLLKRPTTAIALIGGLVTSFLFITFTLRAMLGLGSV
ncbi:MAG: DUF751 family protein [Scytolyngbya sp. HA4215-MV1]|nr:DUF751 family protein [Scytolyngbya sp. HA4215-MV1]